MIKEEMLILETQESVERDLCSESAPGSNDVVEGDATPIEIDGHGLIRSITFLADGKQLVSGGLEGKIRRWRVNDGKEEGNPMDAGSPVFDLAVSKDGKWIVSGTKSGRVVVWDGTSNEKAIEFQAHDKAVRAVDVSADSTRIATGSDDETFSVWSLSTGKRLLGPFGRFGLVVAVKFSPNGALLATATWPRHSVQVYDSKDGRLVANFPIQVNSLNNESLAWKSNNQQLFVSSGSNGNVHCLDVPTQEILSHIHCQDDPRCIAMASNDTLIAASDDSSVSTWDAKTLRELGSVIGHFHGIHCMAISGGHIATAIDIRITLQSLCYDVSGMSSLQPTMSPFQIVNPVSMRGDWDESFQDLHSKLAASNQEKEILERTIQSLCARDECSNRKITHLGESVQELRKVLVTSQRAVDQLTETITSLKAGVDPLKMDPAIARKIADLEQTVRELRKQLAASRCALHVYDKKHEGDTAYADDRIYDAAQHLLGITNVITEDLEHNKQIMEWIEKFTGQCVSKLQVTGDEASKAKKHDEALSAYSAILALTPSPPNTVLLEWARIALIHRSAAEALDTADKFKLSKFRICRTICDGLEGNERVMEAIGCFRNMQSRLSEETSTLGDWPEWELDFTRRCIEKLEKYADVVMDRKDHDTAIGYYVGALSLDPQNVGIIVKCCKARVGVLEDEVFNATMAIERDPLNYIGYKRKHAALHSMGRYGEAFSAFEMMLSSIDKSPNPQIHNQRSRYLDTTPLIRKVIEQSIRDIPHVLIDVTTGRLCDKTLQAAAFEELPIFHELRSSMIIRDRLDHARIQQEVEKFYQYVMFSHRWQPLEPTFQMVENISIYGLPVSPTNNKLVNFCKLVRYRRFRWAWSDTSCVNQADKGVQQESVVAMFRWYRRAALTIIHLLGVHSKSQEFGCLLRSIWNTRGWTYQEYVASRVVQFYTEDWKPYLDLKLYNHKESPVILSEMEQATKFPTEKLATLQPSLHRVREKLYLASKRQTTRQEDIAYSLFGIFNIAIPVIYGEGNQAVGRLLEHILPRSNDVTILAWTGSSGDHHSYLPSDLTVYDRAVPPHVPELMEAAEMDRRTMELRSCSPDLSPIIEFYQRLHDLPSLSLDSSRLRLAGLVFPLTSIAHISQHDTNASLHHLYHATTHILGHVIWFETKDDLAGMHGLVLIHPWISPLVDQDFSGGVSRFDLAARALRLVVGLREPFGALLLASQGRVQYKRVAADSFIQVQIRAETTLGELTESIRTVDVQ